MLFHPLLSKKTFSRATSGILGWCCNLLGGVAVLGITSGIMLALQTGVWQGPGKTSWTAAPCKEGRRPQNKPVTVDSGFSSGSKLKGRFCFWLRSMMGNKTETDL